MDDADQQAAGEIIEIKDESGFGAKSEIIEIKDKSESGFQTLAPPLLLADLCFAYRWRSAALKG